MLSNKPGVLPVLPPGRSRVEVPQSSPRFGVGHAPGFAVVAGPLPAAVLVGCVPCCADGAAPAAALAGEDVAFAAAAGEAVAVDVVWDAADDCVAGAGDGAAGISRSGIDATCSFSVGWTAGSSGNARACTGGSGATIGISVGLAFNFGTVIACCGTVASSACTGGGTSTSSTARNGACNWGTASCGCWISTRGGVGGGSTKGASGAGFFSVTCNGWRAAGDVGSGGCSAGKLLVGGEGCGGDVLAAAGCVAVVPAAGTACGCTA